MHIVEAKDEYLSNEDDDHCEEFRRLIGNDEREASGGN